MRITLVAERTIPCKGYGGTERQVDWLATELARLGHQVVLIAGRGSAHPHCEVRQAASAEECRAAIPSDTDIVHFNGWYIDVPGPALYTAQVTGVSGGTGGTVTTLAPTFVSTRIEPLNGLPGS